MADHVRVDIAPGVLYPAITSSGTGASTNGLRVDYDNTVFTTKEDLLRSLEEIKKHILEQDFPAAIPG